MTWVVFILSVAVICLQMWVLRVTDKSMSQWRALVDDMHKQTDDLIAALEQAPPSTDDAGSGA